MRPPTFIGGNGLPGRGVPANGAHRFNEAADFHRRKLRVVVVMRPLRQHASMRPPTFIGGNALVGTVLVIVWTSGFNEAADFHRRKRAECAVPASLVRSASMRPPTFIGGNGAGTSRGARRSFGFNEAADFHRRKPARWSCRRLGFLPSFNEAADFHRRKRTQSNSSRRRQIYADLRAVNCGPGGETAKYDIRMGL